jgi:hypothetical protein
LETTRAQYGLGAGKNSQSCYGERSASGCGGDDIRLTRFLALDLHQRAVTSRSRVSALLIALPVEVGLGEVAGLEDHGADFVVGDAAVIVDHQANVG